MSIFCLFCFWWCDFRRQQYILLYTLRFWVIFFLSSRYFSLKMWAVHRVKSLKRAISWNFHCIYLSQNPFIFVFSAFSISFTIFLSSAFISFYSSFDSHFVIAFDTWDNAANQFAICSNAMKRMKESKF